MGWTVKVTSDKMAVVHVLYNLEVRDGFLGLFS